MRFAIFYTFSYILYVLLSDTPIIYRSRLAQSVMCLTADQGVASSITAWSHTFVEIDHEIISAARYVSDCRSRVMSSIPVRFHTFVEIDYEIISTAILLPSADSRRVTG